MQEHEYKARDKTVQKMSRDGLREKNLRSKKEKRITGRETDEKKTAGHREQELDFGKVRKTHTAEETVEGVKEGKHRLQSRHAFRICSLFVLLLISSRKSSIDFSSTSAFSW